MKVNLLSKISTTILAVSLLTAASCKKEAVADEQENLNVLKIKLGTTTFTWSDTDGAGGAAPKIDTIRLTPNGSFSSEITLQDGSANPVKDLTAEVVAESNDHLFVYKPTGNLTVTDISKDGNGKAFGHTATVKTTAVGTGTLQILLKHLPNKSATDPSTTGETDIDVTFPVVIK